jgi:hypothetical protein
MLRSAAEILREYGPFPGVDHVHGVTFDGRHVWFASGDKLNAFDPASGKTVRSIEVAGHAGTAFDGRHLFQIAEDRICKIDPQTGRVLAAIPAPGSACSGLAWAEGTLWVGHYRDRKIHQIDPQTGAILRTIETNRFVTGVTWVDGELWHELGRVTKAICGESIRERERSWSGSRCRPEWTCRVSNPTAATGSSAGRKEREGKSRPPAQASFRTGPGLRDPHPPHEQLVEAALGGGKPLG